MSTQTEQQVKLVPLNERTRQWIRDTIREKDLLAEVAYTGGDIGKRYVKERPIYVQGYNDAVREILPAVEEVLEVLANMYELENKKAT